MSRFTVFMILLAALIAVSYAAPECPPNSVWNVCGTLCEPTCQNPIPNKRLCPTIVCNANYTGGCRCAEDAVRNNENKCVNLREC